MHLPVQSGSDRILKAMRRGHTTQNYKKRIDKIRNSKRNNSLTTDIIVGFPGETVEDFNETIKLVEYCQFDSAYMFKYSPRPGTPAFEMEDDVTEKEKTLRFIELEKAVRKSQKRAFENKIGTTLEVLAEKVSNRNTKHLNGHSTCQKVVNFAGDSELLGKIVKIKITEAKTNTLYGEIQ